MNCYAAITTLILSSLVGTASATGGMECSINDENLVFLSSAVIPYTEPVQVLKFSGELSFKRLDIPENLKSLIFSDAQSAHHWINEHGMSMGLRLHWAREGAKPAKMDLLIETWRKPEDSDILLGRYTLTLSFTPLHGNKPQVIRVIGKSTCFFG